MAKSNSEVVRSQIAKLSTNSVLSRVVLLQYRAVKNNCGSAVLENNSERAVI